MKFFKSIVAVASIAACCMGNEMPATANANHKYLAAGILAGATCHYLSGEVTSDQAAQTMKLVFVQEGIPFSYGTNPEVNQIAKDWIKTNGCD